MLLSKQHILIFSVPRNSIFLVQKSSINLVGLTMQWQGKEVHKKCKFMVELLMDQYCVLTSKFYDKYTVMQLRMLSVG